MRTAARIRPATMAAVLGLATVAAASHGHHESTGPVRGVSSGARSELVKTIPIERTAAESRKVVMTIGPGRLPALKRDDVLEVSAEVTATTTCVDPGFGCIGRPYGFDPVVGAQIVLARDEGSVGGRHADAVSRRVTLSCSQHRPNRNHHCPLVISGARMKIGQLRDLPCPAKRCRLNLVLDAHHPDAVGGEELVIGADRPDGSIDQSKGRLDAILFRDGKTKARSVRHTSRRRTDRLAMGSSGSGGQQVVYSQKLRGLHRGDVLAVSARQRTDIDHLHYSAFVSDVIVIATSPDATEPRGPARRLISYHGTITETNGFNCTQGSSAFRTPCLSRKVGIAKVTRDVVDRRGRPIPLFVNLISRSFPKLATAESGDHAKLLAGGGLRVRRFGR